MITRLLIVGGLLLVSAQAWAADFTLHGAVKNETAYFVSGEQRFDKIQNRIDLKPEVSLGEGWEFRGRYLGWYDAASDVESANQTDFTKAIQDEYRYTSEVKEAYLLYGADDFDLRLGQQQVVWGKTDGLRLLDIVNPLNMQEFMMDDFLDSRMGVVAARLNYYTYLADQEHEFEFLVIPDAKVAKMAPLGSRWALQPPLPPLPAGVMPVMHQGVEPGWSADATEYGMAWRANLDGWDVSLNWFYGWKDTPVAQKELQGNTLNITPVYKQMHTVGGSFSNAFGAVVLRGELAVNMAEPINRAGTSAATSIAELDTINLALGLDYNQNNWRISPQLFLRHITSWEQQVQEEENSGFISLLLGTDFFNEKLTTDMIALFNWVDDSMMLRPKMAYAFTDQVTGRLGVDIFEGSSGFFGQFADNDRVYTELEYTF